MGVNPTMQIDIESTGYRYLAVILYVIGMVGMAIAFLGVIATFKGAMDGSLSMEETIATCFFFGYFETLFFAKNRFASKLLKENAQNNL